MPSTLTPIKLAAGAEATSTKPKRRTNAELGVIKRELKSICDEYTLITVRQLFYQLVSRGIIDKTEKQYKNTVCRLTSDMRWSEELAIERICDNTREEKVVSQWPDLASFIYDVRRSYRLNYWDHSSQFLQVWLEKEALSGVVRPECDRYGVGLWVSRGYSSISLLSDAAVQLTDKTAKGVRCTIAQFGDHDPSGENIGEVTHRDLVQLVERNGGDPGLISYERVALTPDQVTQWQLPTRPTKTSDSRSAGFAGESVELDALPPDQLVGLVRQVIAAHIDQALWDKLQTQQGSDVAEINRLVGAVEGEGDE